MQPLNTTCKLLASMAIAFIFQHADAQIINTIAGNGTQGYSEWRWGQGYFGGINSPVGTAADVFGDVYIADVDKNASKYQLALKMFTFLAFVSLNA